MRIEDYALIGDCQSAALVGCDGSIDWLCWPRFDSPACFAALLGGPQQGRWLLRPSDENCSVKRRYRDDTLILETEFETAEGAVTLVDFMPMHDRHCDVARIVVGRRGRVRMAMEFILRFDYGFSVPWVTRLEGERGLCAVAGPDRVILRTHVPLRGENLTTVAEFDVREGDQVPFVLTYQSSYVPVAPPLDAIAALAGTEAYWRRWCERCSVKGEFAGPVRRSLLTLKALTYEPTGGIVAAPTTSLPEKPGGVRNWDYRYCWLRDATMTLLAMMNGGYSEEAGRWREWLVRAVAGSPEQMQIMYGVAGERRLAEWEVPWLPGYEGSKPVRIGNAASTQVQLDVYGELMDALYQARKNGVAASQPAWDVQQALLAHLEEVWQQPDEGLWEIRGKPRHFTYSKVMAWVAFDRAVETAEQFDLPGPVARWREVRSRIHADVCAKGFDPRRGTFVQSYGSEALDASLLLVPHTGFLPADDPRIVGTVDAIRRDLMVDGLVRRYGTDPDLDGLPAGEGVFLACSFWLADCLVLLKRTDEARELFERLLALRNDVGLLAEEYDPGAKRFLGNFPQAFSHVALVNTACNLGHAEKPVEQRAEKKAA
ncbi:MAG: glycoside hydrolase family 15 protein [Betaproteobacteria bacterium]|nr:glycoside hydrolase family 15 protein [Betaproteobacteria bacterium]